MRSKLPLTVLILVYNEEKNIGNALETIIEYVDQILIVDSDSTDNTICVALSFGNNIDVINVPFINFSDKLNNSLTSDLIRNEWVMRLDADEVVIDPEGFFHSVDDFITDKSNNDIGIYVIRRYYFLRHWVKYGGIYPRYVLRIWRKPRAVCEKRLLDEKMIINGAARIIPIEIADINQMGILRWCKKHISYAKLEVQEVLAGSARKKYDLDFDRINCENKLIYYKYPLFMRPVLYLLYRMFPLRGYKDDFTAVLYHIMHALIYREMVDYFICKYRLTGKL